MQALAMVEAGIPIQKTSEITGTNVSNIYRIGAKAIERGIYEREKFRQLFLRYVVDSEAWVMIHWKELVKQHLPCIYTHSSE